MGYSAGRDGAGDPTGGASDPAGMDDPAAAAGVWQPDGRGGPADSGGGTTVSSVDFLADLGPSANAQALARLLAAAAAPPWPHELRGYESARRAFENAGNAGAAHIRRGIAVPLRRMAGVKLAAVAGALTVTGVAVAAEADVLPSPIQRAAHQVLGGVGVPDPEPESHDGSPMASSSTPGTSSAQPGTPGATGGSGGDHATGGGAVPGTPTGTASGPNQSTSATADALALCRAYDAQQSGQGGALSNHDRHRLVALAGGEGKLDEFCAQVLATAPPSAPHPTGGSASPSVPADPSHDHKPQGTTSSSTPAPTTSTSDQGGGNGNGHSKTPNPSHPGR